MLKIQEMQRLYVQEPTERSIRSKKEPYACQIKRNSTHAQNEENAKTPCIKADEKARRHPVTEQS